MDSRSQFADFMVNSILAPLQAQKALTPSYLQPYQPPNITPDAPPGKVGPGENSIFDILSGLGADFLGPPGKGAVAKSLLLGPIGIQKLTGASKGALNKMADTLAGISRVDEKKLWQAGDLNFGPGKLFYNPLEYKLNMEISDVGASLQPIKGTKDKFSLEHPVTDIHKLYGIPPITVTDQLQQGTIAGFDPASMNIFLKGDPQQMAQALNMQKLLEGLGNTNVVSLKPKDVKSPVGSTLHEVQHAIAGVEDMSPGFNPWNSPFLPRFYQQGFGFGDKFVPGEGTAQYWKDIILTASQTKQSGGKVDKEIEDLIKAAQDAYEATAGEVTSRAVQNRWAYSQIMQGPPTETFNALVPLDQILPRIQYEQFRAK